MMGMNTLRVVFPILILCPWLKLLDLSTIFLMCHLSSWLVLCVQWEILLSNQQSFALRERTQDSGNRIVAQGVPVGRSLVQDLRNSHYGTHSSVLY